MHSTMILIKVIRKDFFFSISPYIVLCLQAIISEKELSITSEFRGPSHFNFLNKLFQSSNHFLHYHLYTLSRSLFNSTFQCFILDVVINHFTIRTQKVCELMNQRIFKLFIYLYQAIHASLANHTILRETLFAGFTDILFLDFFSFLISFPYVLPQRRLEELAFSVYIFPSFYVSPYTQISNFFLTSFQEFSLSPGIDLSQ